MTSEELQEIRKWCEEAQNSTWYTVHWEPTHQVMYMSTAFADFIANTRVEIGSLLEIGFLLDEVERLQEELNLMRTIFTHEDDGIVMKAWEEWREKFGGED